MSKLSSRDASPPLPGRRAALVAMAGALAAAACGGGGSDSGEAAAASSSDTANALAGNPTGMPKRLTLKGPDILGPNGSAIKLRGINEGTWGEMRDYDAATIAANGATVVRVLIRWWGLYSDPGIDARNYVPGVTNPFKQDHLDQFLREVQWCIDAGLWVVPVIDSNCGQYGHQSAKDTEFCNDQNFWSSDTSHRQAFKDAWVTLAGILKNYTNIAFYELLPEPLQESTQADAAKIRDFYTEMMTAIEDRAGDRRTPFLVGPRNAYEMRLCDEAYLADPRWTNRVVYTGDLFIHPLDTPKATIEKLDARLNALIAMRSSRKVPVFVQQYGVRTADDPGNVYLQTGLDRMNQAGIGYTGWQWRQNTPSLDEFSVIVVGADGKDKVKQDVLDVYSAAWKAPL